MKATAELKMLPVSVLKPAAYNPRKKLKPGDKVREDQELHHGVRLRRSFGGQCRYDDHRWSPETDRSDGAGLHRSALRGGGHRQD